MVLLRTWVLHNVDFFGTKKSRRWVVSCCSSICQDKHGLPMEVRRALIDMFPFSWFCWSGFHLICVAYLLDNVDMWIIWTCHWILKVKMFHSVIQNKLIYDKNIKPIGWHLVTVTCSFKGKRLRFVFSVLQNIRWTKLCSRMHILALLSSFYNGVWNI